MSPPDRFSSSSFESYIAQEPSQEVAVREARAFIEYVRRRRSVRRRLKSLLKRSARPVWKGLYLVGPVGTGKTHLLASMYHALHPEIPCAFMHSSELFRITERPEAFAERLAAEYDVLCLDEVELDDPANEARLIVVLKALERLGVVVLATSNVEPERFLSAQFGNDRFRRFLNEEFRKHYRVIVVGGDDYRRRMSKSGIGWIGPQEETRAAMHRHFEADGREKLWFDFAEFLAASTSTEHRRLVRRLSEPDVLYLAGIEITGTDDALRLLRVIDDLYQAPAPPVLYFTSEHAPETWLSAPAARAGIEQGIAEKFTRTTSRLSALCELEFIGPRVAVA